MSLSKKILLSLIVTFGIITSIVVLNKYFSSYFSKRLETYRLELDYWVANKNVDRMTLQYDGEKAYYIASSTEMEVVNGIKGLIPSIRDEDIEKIYIVNGNLIALKGDGKNDYNKDGLLVYLDAINNTGGKRSKIVTNWENLILNDYEYTRISMETPSWTNNSLLLNGKSDYVQIKGINKEIMTIELVIELKNLDNLNIQSLIGYFGKNGWRLFTKEGKIYTTLQRDDNYFELSTEERTGIINITYRYNEEIQELFINSVKVSSGDINLKVLFNDTDYIYLGKGKENAEYGHINIYSIRIYNNYLSDKQIKKHYEIDKIRFDIE